MLDSAVQHDTRPAAPPRRFARWATVALGLALVGASKAPPQRPATPAQPARVGQAIVPSPVRPASGELLRDVTPPDPRQTDPTARSTAPRARVLRMQVTAYCPCVKCCGPNAQGITASGRPVSHNGGVFVAADTSVLPFGQKVRVPGYADDRPVEVIDRGGAIKGHRLDVYFPSHRQALEWGRQWLVVTVEE